MTTLELFFYIVLPATLVAAGWLAVVLNERQDHRHRPGAAE